MGYLHAILPDDLSIIRHLCSRDHPQKSRLAGPVDPNDPNLVSLLHSKRRVIKNYFFSIYFTDMFNI